VHALLLLIGILLLAAAVYLGLRTRILPAVAAAVVGAAALTWFFSTDVVPGDFTTMTPYVTTLLVLALASQRLRMPAADGKVYRRGEGG
jgi:simple sugar transport system permease protein